MKHVYLNPVLLLLVICCIIFAVPVWSQTPQPFPDTGQTKCFSDTSEINCPQPGQPFYGQDVQYQPRLPRSYTKLGHGGVILADDALFVDEGGPWIMTRDNVTGLIWELKIYAKRGDRYTWQNAQDVFISGLNSSRFGGFSDWRLPSRQELASLINRDGHNPAINTAFFPDNDGYAYFSSTLAPPYPPYDYRFAWIVKFNNRILQVSPDYQETRNYVRAVRGESPPQPSFVDNGDGTVTDTVTGLMWQKATAPGVYTWERALAYAEGLNLAGHMDWRLPNINELQTIIDDSRLDPAVYPVFASDTISFWYWSSTSMSGGSAERLDFNSGKVSYGGLKRYTYYVRAVRGGQVPPPPVAWKTEVGVINPIAAQMSGTLRGFGASGNQVWSRDVTLAGHGRLELDVTTAAGSVAASIKSMRLDVASGQAVGYQKFYQAGQHRVGLEALPRANQNALYLPHIHSDSGWWTGVGLVNTTTGAKILNFSFSDGASATRQIGANSHDAFTVETLRGTAPFIGSAQVPNGAGVAGLMLFSSERTLSGVSLSDATTTTLVYPHLEMNGWWTGFVVYNPNPTSADLVSRVYDSAGLLVFQGNDTVQPYKSSVHALSRGSLPPQASWFTIESTQPVTGFQLFGTEDGNQLGGYSVVDLATTSGVFPKIDRSGWTGIAFVNVGDGAATITLEARNDAGSVVASRVLPLGPKSKEVAMAENLFPGQNIGTATYVRFTSDQPVVGFQLNGSADATMLDAIPALGATHVGTQQLYFPHIDAQ